MFVIGIAGGSGSGKTTLSKEIIKILPRDSAGFLSMDNFYIDRSHLASTDRELINYDHPDAIEIELIISNLIKLKRGEPIQVPQYDFTSHTRSDKTLKMTPKPALIIEGNLVLHFQSLLEFLDLKIYIETDSEIRLTRRIVRDVEERGRNIKSVINQYLSTVKPMHDTFVKPSRKNADIIVSGERENNQVIKNIILKLT